MLNIRTFARSILTVSGILFLVADARCAERPPERASLHTVALTADSRLAADVEIRQHLPTPSSEPWRGRSQELAQRLKASANITCAIQPSLQDERLTVTCDKSKASTLMDAWSIAVGATWKPMGATWILTDVPEAAKLVMLNPLSAVLGSPEATSLNTVTPEQLQKLKTTGKLTADDLLPIQRQAFSMRALVFYVVYNDGRRAIASEAFRSEGVFYATSEVAESLLPGEMGIFFPRTDGLDPEPTGGRAPITNLWTASPAHPLGATLNPMRLPVPLPEATWKPAARTTEEELQFATDARLDVPYKPSSTIKQPLVWQVLGQMSQSCGVDLIAATTLDERKVTVDLSHASVREALKAVEERTGGRWRPVRDIYVLQQDPRVERAAHTWKDLRDRRLRLALEAFQSRLSLTSRKALDEDGTLTPARLTQTERAALIDAMVVAFGTRDNVAARAMELKDVTLKLLPADKAQELPRRIRYEFPGTNGPAEAVEISGDKERVEPARMIVTKPRQGQGPP